jgi:Tfp pilus assembly protein PilO
VITRVLKKVAGLQLWQIDAAGAVMVCAFAGIWYVAGLRPLNEARAAREAMETELSLEQSVAQDKAKLIVTQERILQKVGNDLASTALRIQDPDQINQHVSALERAAARAGLRVDEIKPSAAVSMSRFTTVPIRISGVGEFGAVTSFFKALRADYRDTGVTGFNLKIQDGDQGPGELRFELDLVWYAAPRQPPAKK